MNMLILSLHILAATVMTGAILGVFAAAHARRETKLYAGMLASFVATVVSGTTLLFVLTGGIGRFCVMMSAFTLMTIVARQYYRARVIVSSSL